VVFTTTKFVDLLKLEASMRGGDAPRTVIVPHPLGGLRESEVMEYVAAAVDEVIRIVENGA
jgi:hypothetical protein